MTLTTQAWTTDPRVLKSQETCRRAILRQFPNGRAPLQKLAKSPLLGTQQKH